jgi:hypothetical protein
LTENPRDFKYQQLSIGKHNLGGIFEDLSEGKLMRCEHGHLDPDLRKETVKRSSGWKPICGSTKFSKEKAKQGDLFLFYGSFRKVEVVDGHYRYVQGTRPLHVIFGWLQIGERLPAGKDNRSVAPKWARYHRHFTDDEWDWMYVAAEKLTIGGVQTHLPGGGCFKSYSDTLRLTAHGKKRSTWAFPRSFYPKDRKSPFLLNQKSWPWQVAEGQAVYQSPHIGQEFFLDADKVRGIQRWLTRLFGSVGLQ